MSKKIVVVDDVELLREFMVKFLTKEGYDVVALASGEECLTYLMSNQVDMVLLDIMMEGLSGMEVLEHIRRDMKMMDLPVIMVTSKSEDIDVVEAFESGANDYIGKPIKPSVALARIKTHINLAELHRESLRLKELEALNAMIVTYNHEINGALSIISVDVNNEARKNPKLQRSCEAVDRITSILKKVENVTADNVEYKEYGPSTNMVALKEK